MSRPIGILSVGGSRKVVRLSVHAGRTPAAIARL